MRGTPEELETLLGEALQLRKHMMGVVQYTATIGGALDLQTLTAIGSKAMLDMGIVAILIEQLQKTLETPRKERVCTS